MNFTILNTFLFCSGCKVKELERFSGEMLTICVLLCKWVFAWQYFLHNFVEQTCNLTFNTLNRSIIGLRHTQHITYKLYYIKSQIQNKNADKSGN